MTAKQKPTMDEPWRLLDTASSFLLASQRCETMIPTGLNTFEAPVVPSIVCAAFACEVYLKALATPPGRDIVSGHQLKHLFDALDEELRRKIVEKFRAETGQGLLPLVREFSSAFVEWRYVYEHARIDINFQALKVFARTLQYFAEAKLGSTRPTLPPT